jgi:mono/diheme cytochrome c family protein
VVPKSVTALITCWLVALAVISGRLQAAPSPQASAAAPAAVPSAQALLDRYCVSCHNDRLQTAGIALSAGIETPGSDAERWEKVVRKLRAGVMPPPGLPRPDAATYASFIYSLERALDRAAAAHPNPGRKAPFHRLNRAEYQNAIRDLLAVDVDVSSLLPGDDASYGFDNIAGVLRISPTLMERYLGAAHKISRLAVGVAPSIPTVDTVQLREDLPQDEQVDGLPPGTRGGTLIRYTFPVDGEYVIQARLSRRGASGGEEIDIPTFDETHHLEVSIDGERIGLFSLEGLGLPPAGRGSRAPSGSRSRLDANWHVRVPIRAGPRQVAVTFLRKSAASPETARLPFLRPYAGAGGDTRVQPYLSTLTISGPYSPTGPGQTPSRERIFTCKPARAADEPACARSILNTLARRAYRRPATDDDVARLLTFYEAGRAEGFDAGIQRAIERLLVSPQFLFRIERDPAGAAPNTSYRIDDFALASRLSFFLWSSVPDDELLELATAKRLRQPQVLEAQVRRMLADARSRALVQNFAGQWLYLRNLDGLQPDVDVFPDFDDSLRQALRQETELLVASILREDRSVLDLLNADYTFVNERLARHYGIPNVKGSHFRRVAIGDDNRRGLLGQGSILAVTAYPHRTSPVLRGKWVLENLLGTPPPPPPSNVPSLEESAPSTRVPSMRERMAQHRANPSCASCHQLMDPPGLALENFDAVGRWREVDHTFASIDNSGVLPDGTRFAGAAGLRRVLLNRSDLFVSTFIEKLMTYALGRGVEYYDMPTVRAIGRDAARHDNTFSSIIMGIVASPAFQMRSAAAH